MKNLNKAKLDSSKLLGFKSEPKVGTKKKFAPAGQADSILRSKVDSKVGGKQVIPVDRRGDLD
jgi:hypothetical protein